MFRSRGKKELSWKEAHRRTVSVEGKRCGKDTHLKGLVGGGVRQQAARPGPEHQGSHASVCFPDPGDQASPSSSYKEETGCGSLNAQAHRLNENLPYTACLLDREELCAHPTSRPAEVSAGGSSPSPVSTPGSCGTGEKGLCGLCIFQT